MILEHLTVLAVTVPAWLYEFAAIPAAILGVLFSATLEKVLQLKSRAERKSVEASQTRHHVELALIGIACTAAVFFAGYLAREGFAVVDIVKAVHVIAVYIGFFGGSFLFRKYESSGSAPITWIVAFSLLLIAMFDVWYEEHGTRSGSQGIPIPSPTPTVSSTPYVIETATPISSPSPDLSDASTSSDEPSPSPSRPSPVATLEDQVRRVDKGMDSVDPATRLATLRWAVRSGDTYLRQRALSKAFASSDSALRSTALRAALETSSSFGVSIEGALPTAEPISERIGRSFQVDIQDAATGSGRYRVTSSISRITGSVVISGQNISFNLPGVFNADDSCSGSETMLPRRSVLKGRMHCKYDHGLVGLFTRDFDIVTDVLP